jgi:hypothetical protein
MAMGQQQFGWHVQEMGFTTDAYVQWPEGFMPASTIDGLKAAGFAEAPVLSGGRKVGVMVYRRDADAQQAFHLGSPQGRDVQYAVTLRSGAWEDGPIFRGRPTRAAASIDQIAASHDV